MNIINTPSPIALKVIGKQKVCGGTFYRPSLYLYISEIDGEIIACNSLTHCIATVSEEEREVLSNGTDNVDGFEKLVENWFLVPKDFDDYKMCIETRELLRVFMPLQREKKYVVMTTLDCNARCFYCYQMGRNKNRIPMSLETAEAVADYIINTVKGCTAVIQWYGGEPLYNDAVIDLICDRLQKAGVEYRSTMISNLYLLSEDILDKAVDFWKLGFVNMPIDGTEEVYNKTKAYIHKDVDSHFKVVMDNVKKALEKGIRIVARVNFDQHNKEDIFALAKDLYSRFGEYDNFEIYSDILYENAGPKSPVRKAEERMQLVNNMIEFENYCMELGLNLSRNFPNVMTIRRCMADNDSAVVISPDGKLGKCDHCMASKIHGTVFSSDVDKDMLESFKKELNCEESCRNCMMLPNCIRIVNCPDDGDSTCDDAYKMKKKHLLDAALKNEVRNIKAGNRRVDN